MFKVLKSFFQTKYRVKEHTVPCNATRYYPQFKVFGFGWEGYFGAWDIHDRQCDLGFDTLEKAQQYLRENCGDKKKPQETLVYHEFLK